MRKIASLLLVVLLMLFVTACGKGNSELNQTSEQQNSQITQLSINSETTSTNEDLKKTEKSKISDQCDKVLAFGYDADNNYYELVANENEDYSGTKIEMGIIKNNKWVIPMTSKSPFVSESGLLVGAQGNFKGSIYEERFARFYYIGAGCFCYESEIQSDIIWNGNTKKSYSDSQIIFKGTKPFINNDGLFLVYCYDNEISSVTLKLLDVNSMSIKTNSLPSVYDYYCFPYSEGLFAYINKHFDTEENGFYDLNGKKVIDLSKYQLAKNTYTYSNTGGYTGPIQDLVFKGGKCTFMITNDQGSNYTITIDKTGNVINSMTE